MNALTSPVFSIKSIFLFLPISLSLISSTCVSSMLPKNEGSLAHAIIETFSFHCSHYYILFSTQLLVAFSGMIPAKNFCRPLKIFFPTEMDEVSFNQILIIKLANLILIEILNTLLGCEGLESTRPPVFERSRVSSHSRTLRKIFVCSCYVSSEVKKSKIFI